MYTIDQVPNLPPTISELAAELYQVGLQDVNSPSNLLGLIQGAGLVDLIAESPAVTGFAPIPAAFDNGPDYGSNLTRVREAFAKHMINGSVVYSNDFASGNPVVSAGGEALKFTFDVSGTYVSSGNSSARIVQSDIIISNGVLHLIDTVLDRHEHQSRGGCIGLLFRYRRRRDGDRTHWPRHSHHVSGSGHCDLVQRRGGAGGFGPEESCSQHSSCCSGCGSMALITHIVMVYSCLRRIPKTTQKDEVHVLSHLGIRECSKLYSRNLSSCNDVMQIARGSPSCGDGLIVNISPDVRYSGHYIYSASRPLSSPDIHIAIFSVPRSPHYPDGAKIPLDSLSNDADHVLRTDDSGLAYFCLAAWWGQEAKDLLSCENRP